ncbi:MAG: hypothetical protein LLG00_09295 [Planctomycetaceae bacterium]|nr:hypothetical protein [Planctomycetaceae bacterium]
MTDMSLTKALGRFSVCSAALAIVLLSGPACATILVDTGNPDGLIATASRPGPGAGGGANQETESADDFVLAEGANVTQCSFIGLLPAGVASSSVAEVRVQFYRVFPNDSDTNRTPNVPTRVNSPSDVEFADRDSAAGNLSFSTTLLSSSFAALNSVDTGIHASPNQHTGGEGQVTGQEVQFNVTFTTPLSLPADHYFLVPQVLLSDANDHFLWLSSPKPIVSPGTPFAPDLQSWIRNADLDPDWLRIGTDIVGGTAYNASFTLSGDLIPEPASSIVWLVVVAMGLVICRSVRRNGARRRAGEELCPEAAPLR